MTILVRNHSLRPMLNFTLSAQYGDDPNLVGSAVGYNQGGDSHFANNLTPAYGSVSSNSPIPLLNSSIYFFEMHDYDYGGGVKGAQLILANTSSSINFVIINQTSNIIINSSQVNQTFNNRGWAAWNFPVGLLFGFENGKTYNMSMYGY